MILKKLPGVDSRLNDRYHRLVAEHMNSSDPMSAGLKALPDKISNFALFPNLRIGNLNLVALASRNWKPVLSQSKGSGFQTEFPSMYR